MRESFATNLSMLPALNIRDPEPPSPLPTARRKLSPTAPKAIEVANPPYCHNRPKRDEGTRDSCIWNGLAAESPLGSDIKFYTDTVS